MFLQLTLIRTQDTTTSIKMQTNDPSPSAREFRLLLNGLAPSELRRMFLQLTLISPDGLQVLLLSDPARLWEIETGKLVGTFNGDFLSAAFSPDGGQVLTGSWDKTARLWEAATGKRKNL
jgi:WD40 repeat protein